MEENNNNAKEMDSKEMDGVSGGSLTHSESSIREAGIELLKADGTPGVFGSLWDTGDYYFQGKKLNHEQIDALKGYRKKYGRVAPSLDEALKKCPGKKW